MRMSAEAVDSSAKISVIACEASTRYSVNLFDVWIVHLSERRDFNMSTRIGRGSPVGPSAWKLAFKLQVLQNKYSHKASYDCESQILFLSVQIFERLVLGLQILSLLIPQRIISPTFALFREGKVSLFYLLIETQILQYLPRALPDGYTGTDGWYFGFSFVDVDKRIAMLADHQR